MTRSPRLLIHLYLVLNAALESLLNVANLFPFGGHTENVYEKSWMRE